MTRADTITLTVVGCLGVGIGWLIPGCPGQPEPEPTVAVETNAQENRIRTIEERIEAPDGTTTIRIITYVDQPVEAEG